MSVAAAGTRGDAPSSDQLLYNHTWCHPHLYISTFLGCVCSVPFSCGVCSGISIQSMCLMHHLLDTHLGFVVACGVQIAGAVKHLLSISSSHLCEVGPKLFSCFTSILSMPASFPFLSAAILFCSLYRLLRIAQHGVSSVEWLV